MNRFPSRILPWIAGALVLPAAAQTPPPAPVAPPAAPASAPPQRIEITGGRETDTEQRRRSTAAKIIVGREEIEQYGDANIGETLRRLPGVTTGGTPGRGGAPRMRGLGGGYTQLLIDGQPIPRGFSLESLTPDQVERIEILRAPTAETGARAIAGTINVVLREGYRRRLNDLNLQLGAEDGSLSPGLFWGYNNAFDELTANLNAGVFRRRGTDESIVVTESTGGPDGDYTSREERNSESQRRGLNLGARLQWRLGAGGDSLTLAPNLFHVQGDSASRARLEQEGGIPLYEQAATRGSSGFTNLRLNGQWRQRLGPGRAEGSLNGGLWRAENESLREETAGGVLLRTRDDRGETRERSLTLGGKYTVLLGGEAEPGREHNLVTGAELEATRRSDTRTLLENGLPLLADFGENLRAESTRLALYAQNEWTPAPKWATHAGLRWEGIRTVGDLGDGTRPSNTASVLTPLAHAVWKPEPDSRSQLRASLTRSWRAPALGNLIARPSPNARFPVDGPNEPTFPDRAGNPDLKPELATGIDLAWEHFPSDGGVLSVSLFHRRIRDLMRSVTALEEVSWSPVPRWVSRTRNVGDATTSGLELEAKGRLDRMFDRWWPEAPRLDVRANASVFRSRVRDVSGPDNRLEQQPDGSLNLGGDYQWRTLPLKVGGNLNWVPAYETQNSDTQRSGTSTRRVFDLYALWTFSPAAALRVSATNVLPRDSDDFARYAEGGFTETTRTLTPSFVNWQLRLELKL